MWIKRSFFLRRQIKFNVIFMFHPNSRFVRCLKFLSFMCCSQLDFVCIWKKFHFSFLETSKYSLSPENSALLTMDQCHYTGKVGTEKLQRYTKILLIAQPSSYSCLLGKYTFSENCTCANRKKLDSFYFEKSLPSD